MLPAEPEGMEPAVGEVAEGDAPEPVVVPIAALRSRAIFLVESQHCVPVPWDGLVGAWEYAAAVPVTRATAVITMVIFMGIPKDAAGDITGNQ